MHITFPNESTEYRAARERLLDREIELRRANGSRVIYERCGRASR